MKRRTASRSRAPSQRQLRVGELVRSALVEVLQRGDLHDPELEGVSITVSEVRLSPDLKVARAFVMPLGGGDEEELVSALGRAAPYLRHEVNKRVHLKFSPELRFEIDRSFDEAGKIGRLLQDIESDERGE